MSNDKEQNSKKSLLHEYMQFLKEYNIISLALAFVMGAASTSLVNSLVKDVVMPFISPLVGADSWREASFSLGPVVLNYGSFLAELLNFIILGLIVFFLAKKIFKIEKLKK